MPGAALAYSTSQQSVFVPWAHVCMYCTIQVQDWLSAYCLAWTLVSWFPVEPQGRKSLIDHRLTVKGRTEPTANDMCACGVLVEGSLPQTVFSRCAEKLSLLSHCGTSYGD